MPKPATIIDQQEAEAKRLGIELEQEDDNKDQPVNPQPDVDDDSKESEEEKPKEKIEEDEAESEKKDDEKSEDEEEDKNSPKNPPKGSLQQEAFKQREQKRLESIVQQQLGPITESLKGITDALTELKTAKTPEQKQEAVENIDEELAKIAETEKIPLEQMKKIVGVITKQVQSAIAPQLKKVDEFAPIIEQRTQADLQRQADVQFSKEWEDQGEPVLAEQYKDASPKQLKDARTLLSQLAVSADYGDTRGNKDGVPEHPAYPLDYIIYKEAEKFDTILRNPKKKTFESSSSLSDDGESEQETLGDLFQDKEITSAKEAVALDKKINKAMGKDRTVVRRQGINVDITG